MENEWKMDLDIPDIGSLITLLSGIDYLYSVSVTVDNNLLKEDEELLNLKELIVDGLSTSIVYNQVDSLWIQAFDNETNIAINEPILNSYNPNLKNTMTGTVNCLIKIEGVDLDNNELGTDKYLVSIRKDGYRSLDFLIDVENIDTTTDDEEDEETPTNKMNVWGIDSNIVVNGGSVDRITDETDDTIVRIYLKII